jgi:hypothetical protein
MHTEQLQVLVNNLRAEVGHSLSVAQGVNQVSTLKYLIARTQEELWTAFAWPDLAMRVDMAMVAGQYGYPLPTVPVVVSFDMIRSVWVSMATAASWSLLSYGIPEDYILPGTVSAPGANNRRADPVEYWESAGGDTFRVWPTPDTGNCRIRFKYQQALAPLVADTDVCTIDATAIVMFAAAEVLARAKAEDADTKQQKAQRHLTKLLGNKVTSKQKVSSLGGGAPTGFVHRKNSNLIFGPGAG